jgi:hypothetical protein
MAEELEQQPSVEDRLARVEHTLSALGIAFSEISGSESRDELAQVFRVCGLMLNHRFPATPYVPEVPSLDALAG